MNQMTSPALALAISSFSRPVRCGRPHEAFGLPDLGLFLRRLRIGFDDLGGEQGFEPAPRQPDDRGATAASTCIAESRLRCRVACATFRARHDATWPTQISCHSSGSRCRRSNASAIKARADPSGGLHPGAKLGGGELQHLGVPCRPTAAPAQHRAAVSQAAAGCRDGSDPPNVPPAPSRRIPARAPGGGPAIPATVSSRHRSHPLAIEHTFILDCQADTLSPTSPRC